MAVETRWIKFIWQQLQFWLIFLINSLFTSYFFFFGDMSLSGHKVWRNEKMNDTYTRILLDNMSLSCLRLSKLLELMYFAPNAPVGPLLGLLSSLLPFWLQYTTKMRNTITKSRTRRVRRNETVSAILMSFSLVFLQWNTKKCVFKDLYSTKRSTNRN